MHGHLHHKRSVNWRGTSYGQAFRSQRLRKGRTVILAGVAALVLLWLWQYHLVAQQIRIKSLPTEFAASQALNGSLFIPPWKQYGKSLSTDERSLSQCRFKKTLGVGREGRTSVLQCADQEVVLKQFFNELSVNRNIMPSVAPNHSRAQGLRWPTEIATSLQLARTSISDQFVELLDYGLTCAVVDGVPDSAQWLDLNCPDAQWYSVQPFVRHGTLKAFARHQQIDNAHRTPNELDSAYRASFNGMMRAIYRLHNDQQLCHDDIKASNIFVANQSLWQFGDLGQVRQPSHPYHQTAMWLKSEWSDCRLNDSRRLVKLYLGFLREASEDHDAFDDAFLEGVDPWSKLYWDFLASPCDARELLERSLILDPIQVDGEADGLEEESYLSDAVEDSLSAHSVTCGCKPSLWMPVGWVLGYRRTIRLLVGEELACKLRSTSDSWLVWLGLRGWLLETPCTCKGVRLHNLDVHDPQVHRYWLSNAFA